MHKTESQRAKIDENLDDAIRPKHYHKSMKGSTKQIQTHEDAQGVMRGELLVAPSHGKSGGGNLPPYKLYGSLERLARILVDIARNPNTDNETISDRNDANNSLQ